MKLIICSILIVGLASQAHGACKTIYGKNCLSRAQRTSQQQGLYAHFAGKQDGYTFEYNNKQVSISLRQCNKFVHNFEKLPTFQVCLYETDPAKYNYFQTASCTADCGCSSGTVAGKEMDCQVIDCSPFHQLILPDPECKSGANKCLSPSEVPTAYFNKFWAGNGSPCFAQNGGNVSRDISISFLSQMYE